MPSRTDLLHSYQFRSRRVLAALVMGETDPGQSPLRRGVGATFAGLMIAILAGAGFGIYGLVTKVGGDAWRTPDAIVVERETGATFVYRDEVLVPTLNLASAMLAAGQPNPAVHRVSSASLTGVARGLPIGIPGAPDSLPSADLALPLPWTVCAATRADGDPQVALAVGVGVSGGTLLRDKALLVRDAERDEVHLVWHSHRYRVMSPDTVVQQIFGFQSAVDVGPAFINALPAGLDIAPIPVSRRGSRSAAVEDYRNGDVLVLATAGAGEQYYLVLDDGLYPLTAVDKAVLDASREFEPIEISSAVQAPTSALVPSGPEEARPPAEAPSLEEHGQGDLICSVSGEDPRTPQVTVGGEVLGLDRAIPTAGTSTGSTPLANAVLVPAGRVAVIRAVATADAPAGSYLIVTDLGFAYPVPQAEVLSMLGYSPAQAVDVPAPLAALVPAGPVLDPAVARERAEPAAAA